MATYSKKTRTMDWHVTFQLTSTKGNLQYFSGMLRLLVAFFLSNAPRTTTNVYKWDGKKETMQHNARKMCILGTYVQRLVAFLSIFLFFCTTLYRSTCIFVESHLVYARFVDSWCRHLFDYEGALYVAPWPPVNAFHCTALSKCLVCFFLLLDKGARRVYDGICIYSYSGAYFCAS